MGVRLLFNSQLGPMNNVRNHNLFHLPLEGKKQTDSGDRMGSWVNWQIF